MNAAARALEQHRLFTGDINHLVITKDLLMVITLTIAMLLSAFAVVYVKNEQRRLVSETQREIQTFDRLEVEKGQLLLEQSTLVTSARIQNLAQQRLAMKQVSPRHITLLK